MHLFSMFSDFWIKSTVLAFNILSFILLDANANLGLIERGGIIALLLLATYFLWKMVEIKDKTIKENYESRISDKDKEIQTLKDLLNRK